MNNKEKLYSENINKENLNKETMNKDTKDLILDGVPMSFEQSRSKKPIKEVSINQKQAMEKGKNISGKNKEQELTPSKKEEKPKQIVRKKGSIDDVIKDAGNERELDTIERKLAEGDRLTLRLKTKEEQEIKMTIERRNGQLIYKKDGKEIEPEEFNKIIVKEKPKIDLTRITKELRDREEERRKYNEQLQMERRTANEFARNEYEKKNEHIMDYEAEETEFDGETFYDEAKGHSDEIHKVMTQKDPDR